MMMLAQVLVLLALAASMWLPQSAWALHRRALSPMEALVGGAAALVQVSRLASLLAAFGTRLRFQQEQHEAASRRASAEQQQQQLPFTPPTARPSTQQPQPPTSAAPVSPEQQPGQRSTRSRSLPASTSGNGAAAQQRPTVPGAAAAAAATPMPEGHTWLGGGAALLRPTVSVPSPPSSELAMPSGPLAVAAPAAAATVQQRSRRVSAVSEADLQVLLAATMHQSLSPERLVAMLQQQASPPRAWQQQAHLAAQEAALAGAAPAAMAAQWASSAAAQQQQQQRPAHSFDTLVAHQFLHGRAALTPSQERALLLQLQREAEARQAALRQRGSAAAAAAAPPPSGGGGLPPVRSASSMHRAAAGASGGGAEAEARAAAAVREDQARQAASATLSVRFPFGASSEWLEAQAMADAGDLELVSSAPPRAEELLVAQLAADVGSYDALLQRTARCAPSAGSPSARSLHLASTQRMICAEPAHLPPFLQAARRELRGPASPPGPYAGRARTACAWPLLAARFRQLQAAPRAVVLLAGARRRWQPPALPP